jgi:predicted nuclease of predicted toxin-antitoxin system
LRLLLDEMLPATVARQLRSRGVDTLAVVERLELRGLADDRIFLFAQAEGRAVVTYDTGMLAHDRACHAERRQHCDLILLTQRRFPQRDSTTGTVVRSLEALATGDPTASSFVHWLR